MAFDPVPPLDRARVAVVHYWMEGFTGGEKVVHEILKIFPQADIFVLVHDPKVSAEVVAGHKLTASFLQKVPGIMRLYRKLLPLMPMALEALDLRDYDLMVSSESGPAKGIVPPLGALNICYCHSPMRYLWDQAHAYREEAGLLTRIMMTVFGPRLRLWDYQAAQRVDAFVANSRHIQKRIRRYYGLPSTVIHSPVDTHVFAAASPPGDYYLITGRHVGYKRIDLAIEMANRTGRQLIVTGLGPETARLRKLAGANVEFRGQVSQAELSALYAGAKAFLMPGEEDFGITPIEAMAAGRPVIAYGRGGALDSVVPSVSGLLFEAQTADALIAAVDRFERTADGYDPARIAAHAEGFSAAHFRERFGRFVAERWTAHHGATCNKAIS